MSGRTAETSVTDKHTGIGRTELIASMERGVLVVRAEDLVDHDQIRVSYAEALAQALGVLPSFRVLFTMCDPPCIAAAFSTGAWRPIRLLNASLPRG
jgi:hypothetical protein